MGGQGLFAQETIRSLKIFGTIIQFGPDEDLEFNALKKTRTFKENDRIIASPTDQRVTFPTKSLLNQAIYEMFKKFGGGE